MRILQLSNVLSLLTFQMSEKECETKSSSQIWLHGSKVSLRFYQWQGCLIGGYWGGQLKQYIIFMSSVLFCTLSILCWKQFVVVGPLCNFPLIKEALRAAVSLASLTVTFQIVYIISRVAQLWVGPSNAYFKRMAHMLTAMICIFVFCHGRRFETG